jgi:hypothetical protein
MSGRIDKISVDEIAKWFRVPRELIEQRQSDDRRDDKSPRMPKRDIIVTEYGELGIGGEERVTYAYRCSECDEKFATDDMAYAHECQERPTDDEYGKTKMDCVDKFNQVQSFYRAPKRQHISDAAAENLCITPELRAVSEEYQASRGTMLVTVEEWQQRHLNSEPLNLELTQQLAEIDEEWKALSEAVDFWKKSNSRWERIADGWRGRAEMAEAKLAAAEDFTRQYADRIMASHEWGGTQTTYDGIAADVRRKSAALLTVAEPTHRLGGDKAR